MISENPGWSLTAKCRGAYMSFLESQLQFMRSCWNSYKEYRNIWILHRRDNREPKCLNQSTFFHRLAIVSSFNRHANLVLVDFFRVNKSKQDLTHIHLFRSISSDIYIYTIHICMQLTLTGFVADHFFIPTCICF